MLKKGNDFLSGKRDLERINQVLHGYVHNYKWAVELEKARVVMIYNGLRDRILHENSRAYKVKDRYLYIYVETSIYANEISLRSMDIVKQVNQKIKDSRNWILGLKLNLGLIQRLQKKKVGFGNVFKLGEGLGKELKGVDREYIQDVLKVVEDKELKVDLERWFRTVLMSRKMAGVLSEGVFDV